MGYINRDEPPKMGREVPQAPTENFSERYVRFLTTRCNAHLAEDGRYRNSQGAVFCSCDMCGQVSVGNFGGEYCVLHLTHHAHGEADFFTARMHHYRPLVILAKTADRLRLGEGAEECINMFCQKWLDFGLPAEFVADSDQWNQFMPMTALNTLISMEWDAEEKRRKDQAAKDSRRISKAERVRAQLAKLSSKLSTSQPISPRFGSDRNPPFPTEDEVPF